MSALTYPKRLIEVDLPIARISAHARREKSIRHGHISTLHIWWARRPLAACRAVICAALWPDPADPLCPQSFRDAAARWLVEFAGRVFPKKINEEGEQLQDTASPESLARWEVFATNEPQLDPHDHAHQNVLRFALLDFIADFANWANSTVPAYLETSRALTHAAHEALGGQPGTRPLVVDPFAGGGSIPLEGLRVGADVFASDLNPVAVLINKVVLEYIPKYANADLRMKDAQGKDVVFKGLAESVLYWGNWVKERAEVELARFYPKDSDGSTPIAYLWARTVLSEAPGEASTPTEIPLIRSMWLCKKRGHDRVFRWKRNQKGHIESEIREVTYADGVTRLVNRPLIEIVDPDLTAARIESGTSSGGSATCPLTAHTTSVESVRRQLSTRRGGASDARLICVVTIDSASAGRRYRLPTQLDHDLARAASDELDARLSEALSDASRVPDERLNHLRGFFNVVLYGIETWGDAFTPRQLLALTTLVQLIQRAGSKIAESNVTLLPVSERAQYLFGKGTQAAGSTSGRKKTARQKGLFEERGEAEAADAGWSDLKGPTAGTTVLDRLHQAMILFGAGRGDLMKRFLVEDGVGKDPRFWKLAQSLAALYPKGTDERRWVEGVLARKKGLGL